MADYLYGFTASDVTVDAAGNVIIDVGGVRRTGRVYTAPVGGVVFTATKAVNADWTVGLSTGGDVEVNDVGRHGFYATDTLQTLYLDFFDGQRWPVAPTKPEDLLADIDADIAAVQSTADGAVVVANNAQGDATQAINRVGAVEGVVGLTPESFGAVGDGIADDTLAIQDAIDAVDDAGGGTIYFSAGEYSVNAPLVITQAGTTLRGASAEATIITGNGVTDVFTLGTTAAALVRLYVCDMRLRSFPGAGHVLNVPFGLAQSSFDRVRIEQLNDGKSIMSCIRDAVSGGVFDVTFSDSYFKQPSTASVPGFDLRGPGNVASANLWQRCRVEGGGDYFFHLEAGSGAYVYGNVWDTVNFEICNNGGVRILSGMANTFVAPQFHDNGTVAKDLIRLDKSAAGPQTRGTTIVGYVRANGSLAVGVADVHNVAGGTAGSLIIDGMTGPAVAGLAVDVGAGSGWATLVGLDSTVTVRNADTARTVQVSPSGLAVPSASIAGVPIFSGATEPEGSVTAPVGALYLCTSANGGLPKVWEKRTGTGNTGWRPAGDARALPGTSLASVTHYANTVGKHVGAAGFDTTAGRPVWATGGATTSTWVWADGTTAHTPV